MECKETLEIPEGIQVAIEDGIVTVVKGEKSTSKNLKTKALSIEVAGKNVIFHAPKNTKRERKIYGTFKAHLKTMFKGVSEGHSYRLKICSGHFPMNVSVSSQEFIIKNFLGESVPRKVILPEGVQVKVSGTEITVTCPDKELAGLAAAKIESLCRITNRDRRRFKDGWYITNKEGQLNE